MQPFGRKHGCMIEPRACAECHQSLAVWMGNVWKSPNCKQQNMHAYIKYISDAIEVIFFSSLRRALEIAYCCALPLESSLEDQNRNAVCNPKGSVSLFFSLGICQKIETHKRGHTYIFMPCFLYRKDQVKMLLYFTTPITWKLEVNWCKQWPPKTIPGIRSQWNAYWYSTFENVAQSALHSHLID